MALLAGRHAHGGLSNLAGDGPTGAREESKIRVFTPVKYPMPDAAKE
jgi:hypothetical protein